MIKIPALSDVVRSFAFSVIADKDYSAISGVFGANSNSAAQAIVNASTCQPGIIPPDGDRSSPGYKDADEINFVNPPTCQ